MTSPSPRPAAVDPLLDELTRLREATATDPALREALCQVEASLRQAQGAAEGATQARGAFLANLSTMGHELRTPLNAILGFAQLLRQDRGLAPEQLTHVQIIHRSGEQLLALINDLLALSRQDNDESRASASFDLLQLVDDLEDMLYLRAERRGLRLRVRRDPDLPRLIRVDGPRLRQLFLLLLGNAIKFARPGELGLALACTPDTTDPLRASLRVVLAIPGLGKADLEAFVRNTSAQRPGAVPQQAGSRDAPPLGQELARALGGELDIAPGELRLLLPVGLIPASDKPSDPAEPTIVGLAPGQPHYRILVAEDRWQSRQLLVQMLSRVGFDVREASDGAEAMELWSTWRPQLIWMDMRMPGITGLEATLRIKRSPGGKETVVIALTASAFEEDPATARAAGCNDFVRKPIRMPEVFAKLREHLGVTYIYESPAAAPPAGATAGQTATLEPAALARLPAAWLATLRAACVQADLDEVRGLIARVRDEASEAAALLDELAGRFSFDRILEIIERAEQHQTETDSSQTARAGGPP